MAASRGEVGVSGAVACTIAAGNYLPFVRVLARSFAAHNPGTPFRVLLVGGETEEDAAEREGLAVTRLRDLAAPGLRGMLRRYGRRQLCAALKPALLRHLLESHREPVVFLDADILVTASLEPLFAEVARHALCLTPHIRRVPSAAHQEGLEKTLLRAGIYNAGFVGVSDREETRTFLVWWEERLRRHCLDDPRQALHYDQRWLDHAIGFVQDLHILRDPGYNAAWWNLGERELRFDGSRYHVDGSPLGFFHFSGFDPSEPSRVTRYVPGWKLDELGPASGLFRHYAELLREDGWVAPERRPRAWPVSWRRFAAWLGTRVTDASAGDPLTPRSPPRPRSAPDRRGSANRRASRSPG